MAGILSYATEQWNAPREFDTARMLFILGNLYRASRSAGCVRDGDRYVDSRGGIDAGTNCTTTRPCYTIPTAYGPQNGALSSVPQQRADAANRRGFSRAFHIPRDQADSFGMFQWFMPNDNVNARIRPISSTSWRAELPVQRVSAVRAG